MAGIITWCRGMWHRRPAGIRRGLLLAGLILCQPLGMAQAENDVRLNVELNKLEDHNGACRAYLVLDNGLDRSVESLRLHLVLFDPDGIITRRLAVEGGPAAAGRTSVRIFDVSGQSCADIGRVLLNDIAACEDAEGSIEGCADLLTVSSRTDVPFDD